MIDSEEDDVVYQSPIDSRFGSIALISVLVKRLGGKIKVTQKDFDEVAHLTLTEEADNHVITFQLKDRDEPI